MTAKEFLSRAYKIDLRINSKIEQVKSLHALAEKATSTLSHTPRPATRNIHSMEDAIVKILDLESEISEDIARLVEVKREIKEVVERVQTPSHRTLLELRYICGKTWEETAETLNYSIQHVHRIHGSALESVETVLRHDRA